MAGGSDLGFTLVQYERDGTLDTSFGAGGTAITPFGSWSQATAVTVQPDGKVLAGGIGSGAGEDLALARYLDPIPTVPQPAPAISEFSPHSGPVGTGVTITGTNLAGASTVVFNDVVQPSFSVDATGTYLTTTVPAGATTGPIWVIIPLPGPPRASTASS